MQFIIVKEVQFVKKDTAPLKVVQQRGTPKEEGYSRNIFVAWSEFAKLWQFTSYKALKFLWYLSFDNERLKKDFFLIIINNSNKLCYAYPKAQGGFASFRTGEKLGLGKKNPHAPKIWFNKVRINLFIVLFKSLQILDYPWNHAKTTLLGFAQSHLLSAQRLFITFFVGATSVRR